MACGRKPLTALLGFGVLALLGVAAVLGGSWRSGGASDPVQLGLQAELQGNPAAALRWANEALARSPADRRALDLKERALARIGRAGPDPGAAADSPRALLAESVRRSLSAGEAREALDQLRPWLSSGPDPEASWLLSRALLQQGDVAGASRALEQAHGFGEADPTRPEPAVYVGSRRCAPCHAEIVRDQAASRHARTLRTGHHLAGIPLPDGPIPDPGDPRVNHTFRRDEKGVELETRRDREVFRAWIEFAVGSGDRGTSFIARDAQQQPRLVRISTFDHHQLLDVTPMAPPAAREPGEWLGLRITDSLPDCLGCHSTKVERSGDPPRLEPFDGGISCERCHGPGGNHLKAVELGFADQAIAQPRLASADQILKLCGQCHQPVRGQTLLDSDPTLVRQQTLTMPRSRCSTSGTLSCITCHNPHRDAETSPAYYESKCLECHSAAGSTACPIDASRGCIACHMPKVENPAEHAAFTDHHIRVHRRDAGSGP
jgi:hypothetical protein